MVRAKFKVQRIETGKAWVHLGKNADGTVQYGDGEVQTVILTPVVGGSEENEEFFASTPGGEIRLSSVNPDAIRQFSEGHEVYVDFTVIEHAPTS